MIARTWRGWTRPEAADSYEALLKAEIFPGIIAKGVPGFSGIALLRRELETETEFMTVMRFGAVEAIAAFAGVDATVAYVPASARHVLARFEPRAAHYVVRAELAA